MVNYLLLQSQATMIRSRIYHMSRMTMFLEGGMCNELRHNMSRCDMRDISAADFVWRFSILNHGMRGDKFKPRALCERIILYPYYSYFHCAVCVA